MSTARRLTFTVLDSTGDTATSYEPTPADLARAQADFGALMKEGYSAFTDGERASDVPAKPVEVIFIAPMVGG